MLTVPEAARRTGRNPETIRRWIREGKLPARKVGTQHVIEEQDLEAMVADEELPVPKTWQLMPDGRPVPNVVRAIKVARDQSGGGMMAKIPTTLDLDRELLHDAAEALGTRRTTDTVHAALREVVARRQRAWIGGRDFSELETSLPGIRSPREPAAP